jgi:C4-type Zn-finger protein
VTSDDLLPCPFCGGIATLSAVEHGKSTKYQHGWSGEAECQNCGARTAQLGSETEREAETRARWVV